MLNNYFSGDVPLMLLSPVGFEGLFVIDPHFNPEKTRQLISRTIGAYSGVKKLMCVII